MALAALRSQSTPSAGPPRPPGTPSAWAAPELPPRLTGHLPVTERGSLQQASDRLLRIQAGHLEKGPPQDVLERLPADAGQLHMDGLHELLHLERQRAGAQPWPWLPPRTAPLPPLFAGLKGRPSGAAKPWTRGGGERCPEGTRTGQSGCTLPTLIRSEHDSLKTASSMLATSWVSETLGSAMFLNTVRRKLLLSSWKKLPNF